MAAAWACANRGYVMGEERETAASGRSSTTGKLPLGRRMGLAFGRFVVKFHVPILIIAVLLLIPSAIGMEMTHINYDLLTYLPKQMETYQGQNILQDEFGKGAVSLVVVEGMDEKQVATLKSEIEQVDHVDSVLWYDSVASSTVPMDVIPSEYYDAFNSGDATMMAVFFDSATSADETLEAVSQIRSIANENVFVSGLSALVLDLRNMSEEEEPFYVLVAVIGAVIALLFLTDSFLVPIIFLVSIGIAIMWNMGTNYFLGEISYITKALAAVLQLAVTMDYSIFLWHAFSERRALYEGMDNKRAMAEGIADTMTAVVSSALTASAGFIALCFMSYTLGFDLGVVMAKGCLLGLLGSLTTLPALILIFDKPLQKTRHRTIIPQADGYARFVTKHYGVLLVIFVIVLIPAAYGFANKPVFYDFTRLFTDATADNADTSNMPFIAANQKVEDDFDVATTEMALVRSDLPHAQAKEMLNRINKVDGVDYALGFDSIKGGAIPDDALPDSALDTLKSDQHQLIVINSSYKVSTDAVNNQIDQINSILDDYDPDAMLIGEAPASKDLIDLTAVDFQVVDWIAIAAIAVILLVVFKSISLPVILVFVIEFAIMINLGIPYYTNSAMVFIAPVCISTIQLGSTVNYAILLTTRYKRERFLGKGKRDAIQIAARTSLPSVVTSGLSFFAATIGVSLYASVEVISSLCQLMARGAIISTLSVLFMLPAMFMLFDGLIVRSSKGFRPKQGGPAGPDAGVGGPSAPAAPQGPAGAGAVGSAMSALPAAGATTVLVDTVSAASRLSLSLHAIRPHVTHLGARTSGAAQS